MPSAGARARAARRCADAALTALAPALPTAAEMKALDQGGIAASNYKSVAFTRAAQSVRDYPIRIHNGREAQSLKWVGNDIGRKIQSILDNEARRLSDSPQAPRSGVPSGVSPLPAPAPAPAPGPPAARKRGGDSDGATDGAQPKRARSQVKLKDLIAAGLLIVGGKVECVSGGVRFEGSIEPSGALRFQGTEYNNPTAFAKAAHAAAGKPESKPDGWTAVLFNSRPLKQLRALAESAPAGVLGGAGGGACFPGGAGGDDVENVLPHDNVHHNTISSSVATSPPHAPGHWRSPAAAAAAAAAAARASASAAASSAVPKNASSVPAIAGVPRYPKMGSAGYALMVGLYRMYHGVGVACQRQVPLHLLPKGSERERGGEMHVHRHTTPSLLN